MKALLLAVVVLVGCVDAVPIREGQCWIINSDKLIRRCMHLGQKYICVNRECYIDAPIPVLEAP